MYSRKGRTYGIASGVELGPELEHGAPQPTPLLYTVLKGMAARLQSYSPIHISNMVLPTVHPGPPHWTKTRTFTLRFAVAL